MALNPKFFKGLAALAAIREFNAFLKSHPEAALELLPLVVRRFRETNEALLSLGAAQGREKN